MPERIPPQRSTTPTPEDPTHAARLLEGRPSLGKTIEGQGVAGARSPYEWMVRTGPLPGQDESQIDRSFPEGATPTHRLKRPDIRRLVDHPGHIPQGVGDLMEVAAEGVQREGRGMGGTGAEMGDGRNRGGVEQRRRVTAGLTPPE